MAKKRNARRSSKRTEAVIVPSIPDTSVDAVLRILQPLVDAVGRTVGPHCEVVLHDLRTPERSIVAISNGELTGRRVGGPVVGGPARDIALRLLDSTVTTSTLSVGYTTETRDGRQLRSTSLILRTPRGHPAIALCLNVDLSAFTMASRLLDEIARPGTGDGRVPPGGSPQPDVNAVIGQIIQQTLEDGATPPKFMGRDDRLRAVRAMHERGLFLIKGGVERAARALRISRFTLYSYLKEVRAER